MHGLTATAAGSPVYGATLQANEVVKYCADKDPCNTIIMIGQKIYPFDKLRYDTFLDILGKESNIKIVATVEGNYSPDVSLNWNDRCTSISKRCACSFIKRRPTSY